MNPLKSYKKYAEVPVNVIKARKGLLFTVTPIIVSIWYLSFSENIFKFIMTPIYTKKNIPTVL